MGDFDKQETLAGLAVDEANNNNNNNNDEDNNS